MEFNEEALKMAIAEMEKNNIPDFKEAFFGKFFPEIKKINEYKIVIGSCFKDRMGGLSLPEWMTYSEYTDAIIAFKDVGFSNMGNFAPVNFK